MADRDPFQNTPDVSAYVARPATQEALEALVGGVQSGERLVALGGPPGIGKTFLLGLLADRCQQEMQLVRIPVPSLPPDGLFGWVLATLGVSAGKQPRECLARETRKCAADGRPLLVVIDDANALPADSAQALLELHAELKPALRIVLTVCDDEAGDRLLSRLETSLTVVRLDQPMSSAETAVYVHSRLAHGGVTGPDAVRFDPLAIERLHQHSGGIPCQVNELADVLLRPEEAARAHELADELRPESLAFALLSEAENENRMLDWSDEELARVVASRGTQDRTPDPASSSLEMGKPYTPAVPVVPPASASALLFREARAVAVPELPELPDPPASGLGGRILDALDQDRAASVADAPTPLESFDEPADDEPVPTDAVPGSPVSPASPADSEESLLLPNPPPPSEPIAAEVAARESLPPLALSELDSQPRSLRSLGVFDGGAERTDCAPSSDVGSSEPMSELASEITRDAEVRRGLRTETFALALGIVLFAGGGLVYWASTPPTIVRPPTIQVPKVAFVPASPSDGLRVASGMDVEDRPVELAASAPRITATQPVPTPVAEPTVGRDMTFWPPLEYVEVAAEQVAAEEPPTIPQPEATLEPASVPLEVASEPVPIPESESVRAAPIDLAVAAPIEPAIAAPIEPAVAARIEPAVTEPIEPAVAAPIEPAVAEPIEPAVAAPIEEPVEFAIAEPVDELVVLEPGSPSIGAAIAGMRPPAVIAAPYLSERLLPVTVRARTGHSIEIDGIARGRAPLFGLLLAEGTHRVVATADDGSRQELLFEVDYQNLEVTFDAPASR